MKKFRHFKLKNFNDERFLLTALELKDFIDFDVKRIYFISNAKAPTGAHCHKKEKELFVMIQGSCIAVVDYGKGLAELRLRGGKDAIYVSNYVWHHFKNFSKSAVLLALSSTNYSADRDDYIEDYVEFKKLEKAIKEDY